MEHHTPQLSSTGLVRSFKLLSMSEQYPRKTIEYIPSSFIILLSEFAHRSLGLNRPQKKATKAINTPQIQLTYHKRL
jgi:hypothetical protein